MEKWTNEQVHRDPNPLYEVTYDVQLQHTWPPVGCLLHVCSVQCIHFYLYPSAFALSHGKINLNSIDIWMQNTFGL